jgi:hypothetical protein
VNAPRRWPLLFIASPAAVAIWSGWVGLGELCGFGLVQPLPGIVAWHLNTAITLPVGVEAYGAFALGAWLHGGTPVRARTFARRSAIGALVLGMLGQIIFHLLTAAGRTRAPWPVVVLVACLPVVTLGFGAALTHLLRAVPGASDIEPGPAPAVTEPPAPDPVPPAADADLTDLLAWLTSGSDASDNLPELHKRAGAEFAADVVAGRTPTIRQIRERLRIGSDTAPQVQAYLKSLVPGTDGAS